MGNTYGMIIGMIIAGWWFQPTYPEKWWSEFVSWDDEIPNWMEKNMFQTINQPYVWPYVGRFPQK